MTGKTVGLVLKRTLSQQGQSQADLARRLGVSQSTVSRWMAGQQRPWRQGPRRKLLALGVDPRHL